LGASRTFGETRRQHGASSSSRACAFAAARSAHTSFVPIAAIAAGAAISLDAAATPAHRRVLIQVEYREFRALNSEIVLAAEGDPLILEQGFERARKFIESDEARFTRFSETSELAALNRASGEWLSVSIELYELVNEAYDYFGQTRGLFDPSILGVLEAAGYDKSMDEIRAGGAVTAAAYTKLGRSDFRETRFNPVLNAIWLPPGLRIDLGGIAKGWIAEQAARLLAGFSTACAVNAGGDLFTVGLPAGESAWAVELEDPRDERESLAALRVGPGAVATSSITKRRWQQGERQMHHLIDPRTGMPAETDWLSVTVIAPHATTAEVFAKSLLIAGSGQAEELAAGRDDFTFIAVDTEGKMWGSNKAGEFLNVGIELA
jgi:thiamine biosynthesis lipoprotein